VKFLLAALILLCSSSFAESATQTDWQGGPGVPGPVTEFGDTYLSDSEISVTYRPGQITLDPEAFFQTTALRIDGLEPDTFPGTGFLESSVFDTRWEAPQWFYLTWRSDTPPGTSIGIQIRASDDCGDMGSWSTEFTSPPVSLIGVLDDSASFVQYRVTLSTTNPEVTPALQDISIIWPIMGIEDWGQPSSCQLLPISPNPASGPVEAVIGLPCPMPVEFLVYDLSGRLEQETGPTDYEPGWHTVLLGEFAPGVYFTRVRAGQFSATHRFAVVE
jgi:hypothetical protein